MTPEEQEIAEVDALILHVVDTWITEGCPRGDPETYYGTRGLLNYRVSAVVDAERISAVVDAEIVERRGRRALIRFWQISWGDEGVDTPPSHCNRHTDCLRSADVARLCWLAAHPEEQVA